MNKQLFIYLLLSCLFAEKACAQSKLLNTAGDGGIMNVIDPNIQKDILTFNSKPITAQSEVQNALVNLAELNFHVCNDSMVSFLKGDIVSTRLMVHITAKNSKNHLQMNKNNKVYGGDGVSGHSTHLQVAFSDHHQIRVPDTAYTDLFEPDFCSGLENNRGKKKYSKTCKVLENRSTDQFYIYMQGGSGKTRYEVTWVFGKSVYLGRVIDLIPQE